MTELNKKEFVKAILSKEKTAGFQLPSKIYKFISLNNDEVFNLKIATFENRQVYLSSPLCFNDPFDCQLNMTIIDSIDDFLKLGMNRKERRNLKKNKKMKIEIEKDATKLQEEISYAWNDFRSRILICCFTESWDNFLMWSHYANTYKGICVEYDVQDLLYSKKMPLPVLYTDKLIATKDYLTKQDFQKAEVETLYKAGIYAVLSKHLSWSYENEWRLIEIENSTMKGKTSVLPRPSAVYFGELLDGEIKKILIDKSVKLGIPNLYDVKISNKQYKLIRKQIALYE